MNIAVFVSGNGTNLQAIIDENQKGSLKCNIALVVSDNKNAYALARAEKAGIETFVLSPKTFKTRKSYDAVIIKELEKRNIELIVLAGFMRLLSDPFVRKYKNRILNIHPALLPSFKGAHGIKDAYQYGVKVTGVTVHFVDEELDHGPIILQGALDVRRGETADELEKRIHELEHKMYPEAVRLFCEGKLKIKGRKVEIIE